MAGEASNVCFRCRIAHSSFSHGGFTLPVTEKGVRSSTTGGINVCVGGGARPLRGGPMTKPDVNVCAFTTVCMCVCVYVGRRVTGSESFPTFLHPSLTYMSHATSAASLLISPSLTYMKLDTHRTHIRFLPLHSSIGHKNHT